MKWKLSSEEEHEWMKKVAEVFYRHGFSNTRNGEMPSEYQDISTLFAYREYGSPVDIGNMIQVEYQVEMESDGMEVGFWIFVCTYAKHQFEEDDETRLDSKNTIVWFSEEKYDANYLYIEYSYKMFEKVEKKIESVFDIVEGKLKNVLHFERM